MKSNKILFFGNSPILTPSITWLEKEGIQYTIYANATQAEKTPVNNNTKAKIVTLSSLAGFDFSEVEQSKDYLGISVGAPWFFSADFINRFSAEKLLNLHGTQLPHYRGGNIYSWFVLNGVRTGMCLLHQLTAQFDSGSVISFEEFLYPNACRKPVDYMHHYERMNADFLLRFIQHYHSGQKIISGLSQPSYLSTYWPRLKTDINGWINWDIEGHALERFISAFDEPYDGAITQFRGKNVFLKDVSFQPGFNHHPFQYGIVFRRSKKWLHVAVNGGELIVSSVQGKNKSDMLSAVREGDRFITPLLKLESGKRRVIKNDLGLSVQPDIQE